MERDRFFTAEQAVEYGLIDGIIESRDLGRGAGGIERRQLGTAPGRDRRGSCRLAVSGVSQTL